MLLYATWQLAAQFQLLPRGIMPSANETLMSNIELWNRHHAVSHLWKSFKINMGGYAIALTVSLPVGFVLGLNQPMRALFFIPLAALRYVPVTALLGVFIAFFGDGSPMQMAFLGAGIAVYLIPTTVQRIDEVTQERLRIDTLATMGATRWQIIRHGYIPAVLEKLSADIRVLLPLSWTYLIAVEYIRVENGGIGALIGSFGGRFHRVDKQFALLCWLLVFSVLQDLAFIQIIRFLFPYKAVRVQSRWRRVWRWKSQPALVAAGAA